MKIIEGNEFGLYAIFMRRLNEIKCLRGILPFPVVFEKLCRNFSIKKSECWVILRILKNAGAIDIIYGHGVKINRFKEGP